MSVQLVPYDLNRVQIWGKRGPGQGVNVVGSQEGCGQACCVEPGVVLLEHAPGSGHERQDVWLDNVLDVPLGCHVALHAHQLAPACVADGSPHHDAAATMRRRLVHAVLLVAFISPAVNSSPPIMAPKQKLGFVREPDVSPMVPQCPVSVLSSPLQSGLLMSPRQDVATYGPAGPQPSSMQPVPDGLVGDSTDTSACLDSGRGRQEAIAEMSEPYEVVLDWRTDARSA